MTKNKSSDGKNSNAENDTNSNKEKLRIENQGNQESSNAKTQLIKSEKEDVKKLEGEDQKLLGYFSKDELIEKIKSIEKELKKVEENLEKSRNESNDWKNRYIRLQADFENAQKRWEKNNQALRTQYLASTIRSLLPLYDSFKKALQDANENVKPVIESFYNQFMGILKSLGAEPIEVKKNDQFDYLYHEALSSIERDDVPNNTIIDVIQDGWKLGKDVIRYAKVIVSREPKPPEKEKTKEEESVPAEEANNNSEKDKKKAESGEKTKTQ
ncbi:MAG: nucleotide exchange factor GrpE [Promethearchaeota archaeon]